MRISIAWTGPSDAISGRPLWSWDFTAGRWTRLPRALQRLGCEHPVTLNFTVFSDPSEHTRCANCGAEWLARPRNRM